MFLCNFLVCLDCSILSHFQIYSYFISSSCGNCTKGYGCTFHLINRRRCRVIYKCEPQQSWLLQLTPKERERIGRLYRFPAQNVLLQDENGQSVRELRHCPRYEFMSDYVNGRRRNVTSERPIATVANFRIPLDDSTTEILEPLE